MIEDRKEDEKRLGGAEGVERRQQVKEIKRSKNL